MQETQRDFKFVAGNNLAEYVFSPVKRIARRMNVVSSGAKKLNVPSVIAQSSAALLRSPGVNKVLQAMKTYRLACSNGDILLMPITAFDAAKHPWLQGAVTT